MNVCIYESETRIFLLRIIPFKVFTGACKSLLTVKRVLLSLSFHNNKLSTKQFRNTHFFKPYCLRHFTTFSATGRGFLSHTPENSVKII